MTDSEEPRVSDRVGLCATCVHAEVVQSSKGQSFYRCRLSETDPAFPKYPALPVMTCTGHRLKT